MYFLKEKKIKDSGGLLCLRSALFHEAAYVKIQIFQPNLPLDFKKPLKNFSSSAQKEAMLSTAPKGHLAPLSLVCGSAPPTLCHTSRAVCCGSWICRTSSPRRAEAATKRLSPCSGSSRQGTVCSLFATDVFMREQHFRGVENRSRTCCALRP